MKKIEYDEEVLTHAIADVCSDALYDELQSYLVQWEFPKSLYKVCLKKVGRCGNKIYISISTPKGVKNYRIRVSEIKEKK